jgi:prophage regulatory protein
MNPAPVPRLLRLREVRSMTGLSQSALYALMKDGQFPRPVKLTERSVAWPESLVAEWITARLAAAKTAA